MGLFDRFRPAGHTPASNSETKPDTSGPDALRLITEGNDFEDDGRIEEALQRYEAAIRVSPGLARAHVNRGNALLAMDKTNDALAAFATALSLDPEYAAARFNMGHAHAKMGQHDAALECYREAIRLKPDFVDAEVALGCMLEDIGQFEAAAASYRRALDIRPDYAEVHGNLAGMQQHLGKLEEAAASYRRALALKPNNAELRFNLGGVLRALGQLDAAAASFRSAFAIDPSFFQAHISLGNVLAEAGKIDDAIMSYRRALEIRPDSVEAYHSLGATFRGQGKQDEAETSLRRALEIDPDCAPARHLLDNVLREKGWIPEYLAPDVFDFANGRRLRRYFPFESNAFVYVVEVSGTCNLRCPSCPVGNFPDANRPKGFMKPELFRSIVEKIKRDHVGENPEVWLFNWGEPMLHPQLPEFISLLKHNKMRVMISTNLNIKRNLEEVIRAAPDVIKISLSGITPESYSKTHVRGNIEQVKANMRLMRDLIDQYQAPIRVWVGHHLYRHNAHESAEAQSLCKTLGFGYAPIQAQYFPVEKTMDLLEGKESQSDAAFWNNFITHPLEIVAERRKAIDQNCDCELRFNMTTINYDGSVALCCAVYDYRNMLGVNFLDLPHDKIQALKYQHPFCKNCYDHSLHYALAISPE